jgi:NAD+ synthase (glutamine-hydrolysing)
VHNSLALLDGGRVAAVYRKNRLPNYGVFDEVRYFEPGSEPMVVEIAGVAVGLTICEDLWEPGPPASSEAESGARLIVNPSGSPYLRGKGGDRERMFAERAVAYGVPIAFCNLVGGQDELVFDGHSFVVGADGELLARAPQFRESLLLWELGGQGPVAPLLDDLEEVWEALVLGLGDYVRKNGFERVLVGLSGGIDSALVAALAADALDAERVACVVMPSPHSSPETQADARTLAINLGAELIELPIGAAMEAYDSLLGEQWSGAGLAAENVQARIRGNLLMALSNDRGSLVLTTGNKSEMSVGYATLYGDMAGGLAVIKDVPKQLVYRLAGHANERAGRELVPASIIERPPSAELRPDQRDDDSLPPYDLLDRVLEGYVERDLSRDALIEDGTPAEVVDEVIAMVDRAEYKRRQAPPGIRITSRAFGRDRRLPITNRFSG